MKVDEEGVVALVKYKGSAVKADHNMLTLELDLTYHIENKHDKIEMFNLKNKICQSKFKDFTSNTNKFTRCFKTEEDSKIQFKRWKKKTIT